MQLCTLIHSHLSTAQDVISSWDFRVSSYLWYPDTRPHHRDLKRRGPLSYGSKKYGGLPCFFGSGCSLDCSSSFQ